MLRLVIEATELYDENRNEFIQTKEQVLQLEHSLVSISKWEEEWNKPFLSKSEGRTYEETVDYIRCMTITQNVKPEVYSRLTAAHIRQVTEYINRPMTATTINDHNKKQSKRVATAEVIYSQMIALGIPFECQKWHLNKLLTLIQVCGIESSPKKKMSQKAIMKQNAALNASRRRKLNSKG